MADLPLIERKHFFTNPDRYTVRISPNGTHIAWLSPLDGVLNLWVAKRDDIASARAVTADKGRGIHQYVWAINAKYLLYLQDKDGNENEHLYAVELASGDVRDLTPFEAVKAAIGEVSHKFPDDVAVLINYRDPQWHDIYRINIITGEMSLLLQHDRFANVLVDDDYCIQAGVQNTEDGGAEIYVPKDDNWKLWDTIPPEDLLTTGVFGIDTERRSFFMYDSRGRNTAAIAEVDIETKQSTVIAEDPLVDVGQTLRHPTDKHIQAVSFTYERKRWQVLDPAVEPDLTHLNKIGEGDVEIVSRSLDDKTWIVVSIFDDGPARYYIHDRESVLTTFLFNDRPDLENLPLAKMRPYVIPSRDGLNLVGYYTLPPGADTHKAGIPDHPLPTVFIPHGGPWGRDEWGFDAWHQWLANRGYAVLTVNFRSSTGFGKAFTNAGDREWGGKIIDDQVDAVQWSVDAGIADPKRIGVMGASFGGYSTLAGLTFNPELFACGVDLVGVANLITWMESIPAYWKPLLSMFIQRVGDNGTEEGRAQLTKHSPLTFVDRICKPLLIGQGANDPRVRKAESDQIVEAMRAKNLPVTYVLYPDEGHGFARPETNLSFNAIAESFLATHLGGRYEPIGDAFEGSSLQVLAGADQIVGVSDALADISEARE